KFGCPRSHVMFLGAMQHALTVKVGDERHLISHRSPSRGLEGWARPGLRRSTYPARSPGRASWPCLLAAPGPASWPCFLALLPGHAPGPCILAAPFEPRVWPPLTLAQAEPGYPRMDTFPQFRAPRSRPRSRPEGSSTRDHVVPYFDLRSVLSYHSD